MFGWLKNDNSIIKYSVFDVSLLAFCLKSRFMMHFHQPQKCKSIFTEEESLLALNYLNGFDSFRDWYEISVKACHKIIMGGRNFFRGDGGKIEHNGYIMRNVVSEAKRIRNMVDDYVFEDRFLIQGELQKIYWNEFSKKCNSCEERFFNYKDEAKNICHPCEREQYLQNMDKQCNQSKSSNMTSQLRKSADGHQQ